MNITDLVPWRGARRDVAARRETTDPMRALQLDVDRAFEQFWRMVPIVPYPFAFADRLVQTDIVPVDVADNGKEITVTAELPGMSDSDVAVSLSDSQLTIRGEKKWDHKDDEKNILVRERVYGAVERTVPLPDGIDIDAAKGSFRDGVLTIVIPKVADKQVSGRRIPVKAD